MRTFKRLLAVLLLATALFGTVATFTAFDNTVVVYAHPDGEPTGN